jgi:hypothetical protein
MKLTFAAKWKQDFSDPVELASFKIADLACGTGTLLMASAQAISDVYIRERADIGLPLGIKDMSTLHRALMENVLHGYDVLPSAVHLTASTLAMLAPEVAFVRMGLFVMPLGMDHGTLNSVAWISSLQTRLRRRCSSITRIPRLSVPVQVLPMQRGRQYRNLTYV